MPVTDEQRSIMMYNWLLPWSIGCSSVIFLETAINIAYFKDVVFGFVSLLNYLGMCFMTWNQIALQKQSQEVDSYDSTYDIILNSLNSFLTYIKSSGGQ